MSECFRFRCIDDSCGQEFSIRKKLYQCPSCRDLLDIVYDFSRTDVDSLKESFSRRRLSNRPLDVSGVWRYRELLPFEAGDLDRVVTMGEGNNPILDAPRCAEYVGLDRLRVKNLGWNPSGSFKDYGMTVAVSQAIRLDAQVVACASTGNTSASMAAYCARAGLRSVVFLPEGQIAFGKLAQALDYGALTLQIQGSFDVRHEAGSGTGCRNRPLPDELHQPLPPGGPEDGDPGAAGSTGMAMSGTGSWCPAATSETAPPTARS